MTTVIGWHSYKGGSGRTLTLANVAYALARDGYNVGCVDLDIESAGLSEVFGVSLENRQTVAELLATAERPRNVDRAVVDLRAALRWTDVEGRLLLLGSRTEEATLVGGIKWDLHRAGAFRDNVLGPISMRNDLDFLMLDSRSGISHQFAASHSSLGERVVICSRLDRQSRSGTRHMLGELRKNRPNIHATIVLTGTPPGDNLTVVDYRNKLIKDERIPGESILEVPLEVRLLLEEEIVTRQEPNSKLAAAYNAIAKSLVPAEHATVA